MTDLLITGATVVTMDPDRRVIEGGAVAVSGDKILAVGSTTELAGAYPAAETVDGTGMLLLPGLIDAHAHAGHGLVKTLGADDGQAWFEACREIYTTGSSRAFWEVEAELAALERLKCGVTTGVSYLGGGDSVYRTDAPDYAERHAASVERIGTRDIIAVGACRPPFPWSYADLDAPGGPRALEISFQDQLDVCERIVQTCHGAAQGRVGVSMSYPVHHAGRALPEGVTLALLKEQAGAVRDLGRRHGLTFTQDGHRGDSLELAHDDFGLLGPDAYMSHCTDLTARAIDLVRETDTRIVHNPSAVASIRGRCPVPELLERGVTVAIGSDGTAPDRSADPFRHMQQAMHYHRRHFRDDQVLPPGKVLEMVTIDAAQALGMEDRIGSIEPGKQADLVLLDLRKPHLAPANMPLFRAIYFANGADIDTVICAGQVLMRGRAVETVEEGAVIAAAEREAALMIERCGFQGLLETPEGFWGRARY